MIDKQLLLDSCHDFEINLPESAPDKLDTYAQLLVEWNEKMNLTAITEPREIVLKHFVDSLLLLKAVELPEDRRGNRSRFSIYAGKDCKRRFEGYHAGQLAETPDLFKRSQRPAEFGLHLYSFPRRGWWQTENIAGKV